jgi:hypothetical protein
MHAANPYGPPVDYAYYKQQFVSWRRRIINLMNGHTITLFGDDNLYLFQMSTPGQNPTYHAFRPSKSENEDLTICATDRSFAVVGLKR